MCLEPFTPHTLLLCLFLFLSINNTRQQDLLSWCGGQKKRIEGKGEKKKHKREFRTRCTTLFLISHVFDREWIWLRARLHFLVSLYRARSPVMESRDGNQHPGWPCIPSPSAAHTHPQEESKPNCWGGLCFSDTGASQRRVPLSRFHAW